MGIASLSNDTDLDRAEFADLLKSLNLIILIQ